MQCDTTTVSPELDAEEAAEDGSSLVVHKRSEFIEYYAFRFVRVSFTIISEVGMPDH